MRDRWFFACAERVLATKPFGVLEMARTGTLAMARGEGAAVTAPAGYAPDREGAADPHDISYSV